MAQLPGTGDTENDKLNKGPADNAGIGTFTLVAKFGLTLSLEYLLAANILQAAAEILDALNDVGEFVLIAALDFGGFADG